MNETDAETIRLLKLNTAVLWQQVCSLSAQLKANQGLLARLLAQVEQRTAADVAMEIDRLAEGERDALFLGIGDSQPDLAAALDGRTTQLG